MVVIQGISHTSLKQIPTNNGDVWHCLKASEPSFHGFGEAYFSIIQKQVIKGWKLHNDMTLNLVVPIGIVRFILLDNRKDSPTYGNFQEVILSRENYNRLTVPPMIWLGFQGLDEKDSLLLNIANIPHNPNEMIHKKLNEIDFDWEVE